jgi:HK97 family phage prohead protease
MEFKGTGSALVKDIDGKSGTVVAYWSAFNNKDDGADIMMPGAWSRSIAERGPQSKQPRVKFLYQHDDKMLVAAPSALVEDDFGLLATYTIPQTTLGKDVLLLYDAGVISEHSVGFTLNLSTWDRAQQARLLQECVLWEGSAVTWGMNSQTPVVAVKALAQPGYLARLAEQATALDKLLHSGNLRDEKLCANLERELKALQTALAPAQRADSAPYTIKGVLDAMTQLQTRAKISTSTAVDPATLPVVEKTVETKDDGAPVEEPLAPDFATMYATERDAWALMSEMQGMLGALRNTVVGMLCAGDLSGLGASVSQFSTALADWANNAVGQECWSEVAAAAQSYGGEPWDYLSAQLQLEEKKLQEKAPEIAPKAAPDAPEHVKAGRVISGTNRASLTKAVDGIADALVTMKGHHGDIVDLLERTAPKTDDAETDDGKEADDEKAMRRAAAGNNPHADTTPLDTTALLALAQQLSKLTGTRAAL